MSWSLEGRVLRSVLVTRLRYLGDIAMATVVLEVLRRGDPELDLGFLCEADYGALLADHPYLSRRHLLASRRRGADAAARRAVTARSEPGDGIDSGRAAPETVGSGTLGTLRELRHRRYDLAVDLFFNPRSAWLLWLAGCGRRIGGSCGWRRRLYSHTVLAPDRAAQPRFWELAPGGLGEHLARLWPLRHEESGLSFAEWFAATYDAGGPCPRVQPPRGPTELARSALARLGLAEGAPFLLLSPGATWSTKEWPAPHWADLARALAEEPGLPAVLLLPPAGAARWRRLAEELPSGPGGVLPVLDLAAALQLVFAAALVVSVDGGIMHAAVALGRPTVALFGPTAPEIWFPYAGRGPYRVLCRRPPCHPCNRHACDEFVCLPELRATEVASAVRELLAETGRPAR